MPPGVDVPFLLGTYNNPGQVFMGVNGDVGIQCTASAIAASQFTVRSKRDTSQYLIVATSQSVTDHAFTL